MGRKWVVTFAIFLLLIGAWLLRWEHGPTQTTRGQKTIYLRDRWTGQTWTTLYGNFNGQVYSGEVVPVPSPESIATRQKQILSGAGEIKLEQRWKQELATYTQFRDSYKAAHDEYLTLVKQMVQQNAQKTAISGLNGTPIVLDNTSIDMYLAEGSIGSGGKYIAGKYDFDIPSTIVNNYKSYILEDMKVHNLTQEINSRPTVAENSATFELENEMWRLRHIITGIWTLLLAASFAASVFFFLCEGKTPKEQDVNR